MIKLFQHSTKKRALKPNAEVEVKLHTFSSRDFSDVIGQLFARDISSTEKVIGIRAGLTAGFDGVNMTKIIISPKICRLLNYVPPALNPSYVPFELSLRRYTCSRSDEALMTENITIINMLNGIRTTDCPSRTLVITPAHC